MGKSAKFAITISIAKSAEICIIDMICNCSNSITLSDFFQSVLSCPPRFRTVALSCPVLSCPVRTSLCPVLLSGQSPCPVLSGQVSEHLTKQDRKPDRFVCSFLKLKFIEKIFISLKKIIIGFYSD